MSQPATARVVNPKIPLTRNIPGLEVLRRPAQQTAAWRGLAGQRLRAIQAQNNGEGRGAGPADEFRH
jgi:hypothetical protein